MNITITLQANERLLNALETIANALAKNNAAPVQSETKAPAGLSIVKEEQPEASIATPDDETYDMAKVRAIAAEVSQAGKKDAIKGLLKQMNVTRVTDLKETQFSEFVTRVKAL